MSRVKDTLTDIALLLLITIGLTAWGLIDQTWTCQ